MPIVLLKYLTYDIHFIDFILHYSTKTILHVKVALLLQKGSQLFQKCIVALLNAEKSLELSFLDTINKDINCVREKLTL